IGMPTVSIGIWVQRCTYYLFGALLFLPGVLRMGAGEGCRSFSGACAMPGSGAGLLADGSQRPWAVPVGVFEGAVEAAEVAKSAGECDRCDGLVGETGVEEFPA